MKINRILLAICISILFNCCRNRNAEQAVGNKIEDHLISANKIITHQESEDIDKYISSKGWKMEKTGTGLRYKIEGKKNGSVIKGNQTVTIVGDVLNMYGDSILYTHTKENPLIFTLGKGEDPKGLEEGLQLMMNGQKAEMILPSHLGFGLSGDGKKIPPRAVLVYNIQVLDIVN